MINRNIQVLRGISVFLVVLFHLDLSFFKFGYLGVDIFFVISGFLIPIIIHKYTAMSFIFARFKRLAPALSMVIILTLALGYFVNMPGEYKNVAESSIYSLLFISPIYFLSHTGYFEQNALLQPLLHTWSLGNEFIAYFFVALFLLISPKKNKICYLSDLFVLILLLYCIYVFNSVDFNYLDPIPRLLIFFISFSMSYRFNVLKVPVPSDKILYFISLLSLLLITFFFGEDVLSHSWPNLGILLLPFLVIPLMLMKESFIPITSIEQVLFKLGDYSYSIYLVHWPIIVFERTYFRNLNISISEMIFILFLITIFSFLFKNLFEKYTRKVKFLYLLCFSICITILINHGFEERVPKELVKYSSLDNMTNHEFFLQRKHFLGLNYDLISEKNGLKNNILIIGDSHSQHVVPIIKSGYPGGIYRMRLDENSFIKSSAEIIKFANKNDVSKILIAYRVSKKDSKKIATGISKISKDNEYKIYILRDIPSLAKDPVACLLSQESNLIFKSCDFNIKFGLPIDLVLNYKDPVWSSLKNMLYSDNVFFINSHEKMCQGSSCLTFINDEFIMRDGNHFNEKLSEKSNRILYEKLFGGLFY